MIRPHRRRRTLVLAIAQERTSLKAILRALRKGRFFRSAVVQVGANRKASALGWIASRYLTLALLAAVLLAVLVAARIAFAGWQASEAWLHAAVSVLALLVGGWAIARLADLASARRTLSLYSRWVLAGETLVVVSTRRDRAADAAAAMSEAAGEHLALFVLNPPEPSFEDTAEPTGSALGEDQALVRAARLGGELADVRRDHPPKRSLLPRLNYCEGILLRIQKRLEGAVRLEQSIALSAEWLLDNAYIVQGHVDDFRRNLPAGYYRELPYATTGRWKGLPRVYAIACELVEASDGALTRKGIESFLQALQTESVLTIAELWALPMMLRLRLIEFLATLGVDVERRQIESEKVAFWANRLLYTARRQPDRMPEVLAAVAAENSKPTPHLVEELLEHLYDEDRALTPVRAWLETKFSSPLEDVIRRHEQIEAVHQASLANAISSLRLLAQFDWRDLFEAVSRVDAVLWSDPAGVYGDMDFETRDSYRHEIERLSRRKSMAEHVLAEEAVAMSRLHTGTVMRHVGYFLVDDGLPDLEKQIAARPPLGRRLRRWTKRHPAAVYLSVVALTTAGLVAGALALSLAPSLPAGILLGSLFLLPAADLAVQLVNYVITRSLRPRSLPKMAFDDGVPDEFRTLVVVPMMLLTPESIRDEVERLEIRALANPDRNLRYALLADYSDAPQEHMAEDLELLDVARQGIESLNESHGAGRFLLFYRDRKWCDDEQCWMGWERKRGKIEELNRLLLDGDEDGVQFGTGSPDDVDGVRFVITLDSDTQLPRDTAARLVATLAHPLNAPELSQDGRRVLRGYGIIQPRVSTSLPSATASIFTRLFTDPTGMDPYTHAVSDVYQDLAGWASYHGKGIYDLRAFDTVVGNRFPDAHLLSHDLIEGAYTRVALASDIELLDLFPGNYGVYSSRQHRWTRGDWQIADWIGSTVPLPNGVRERNPLPTLERWKIFDNLRRSLTPVGVLAMLIFGCALSQKPIVCAELVMALLLASFALPLATRLTQRWIVDPQTWREPLLNLVRAILFTAAMPHQAWVSLNAIGRVVYRRTISHRRLLEWSTASAPSRFRSIARKRQLLLRQAWSPFFAAGAVAIVVSAHPQALWVILPFAILWTCSPFILNYLDRAIDWSPSRALSPADRAGLRHTARETWRYFQEFVDDRTNHLPPDNYQESPRPELAERTSPTNIGLYLASTLTAHDLGYLTPEQTVARISATALTLQKLERYRGHLLNWYDTRTLQPLGERYVSSVDSGNLMGAMWAVRQGLTELVDAPIVGHAVFHGLSDVVALLAEYKPAGSNHADLVKRVAGRPTHLSEIAIGIQSLVEAIAKLPALEQDSPYSYWAKQLRAEVLNWKQFFDIHFGWLVTLQRPPEAGLLVLGDSAHENRREALRRVPSLREIATGSIPGVKELFAASKSRAGLPDEIEAWLSELAAKVADATAAASKILQAIESSVAIIDELDRGMDMGFLYDPERRLFAIGYNIADQRLDRSYYDLLASEARLGSFLAIARGDVPTEHWWALGRPFGSAYLTRPLLSWNGTMFEYLMPLLLTRSYSNSLLDRACQVALECQISYARQRGIPWGISESAYSALDARQVYQYRAFGVPVLALKRGLENDLVVSPYSSALALASDPLRAVRNLRRSGPLAKLGMRGGFGFYEAIDYTRHREPGGERGLVVHSYMAHHQGMTLVAIANAVGGDLMRERFHADPRVQATTSLLYERVPVAPPTVKTYSREAPTARLTPIVAVPAAGRVDTPHTPTPRTCLLANADYRVLMTNAGGGYSRWRDFDITRWRADTTCDAWGKFCYLRDVESGYVWSATHHPTGTATSSYRAVFSAEKAEIRRRDRGIETITEVVVSPEDDAEICRLTLINRSSKVRRIEVTTYAELALAPNAADRAHPAFNKMFIQTEMVRDLDALLAWRRLRSPEETPVWAAHLVASESRAYEATQFETDRASFIGRGRSAKNPIAIGQHLTSSEGYVLDPIFSLRRTVTLDPGQRLRLAIVTLAGSTREQVIALATKYRDPASADRAIDLAWTHAQLELRHLRIKPSDAQLYQQLASHVLYPHAHLRAPVERLGRNRLNQRHLWAHGISGDLPIVVLTVDEASQLDLVQEVLAAHAFWRNRGLMCDLVILNQEAASYEQPLQVELQKVVAAKTYATGTDQPGGVFLRPAQQIPPDDLNLIFAAAHVVLVGARGSLSQQIGLPADGFTRAAASTNERKIADEPSAPLPFMELLQFNGIGGFTQGGREYVIYLDKGVVTPRPWSNVMSNPSFGALVTDEGPGFTWFGNSQSYRLTAWSNDPVSNPAGDAIYLHDHELNVVWTPTPLPIRENDPYRTRHGQGYSVCEHNSHNIEQELTTFVPLDDGGGMPVRIQVLRLKNKSSRPRTLTVTFYADWILGADRESTQLHVRTKWDLASEALFATNPFSLTGGDIVAFAACSRETQTFSADRTDVLGRNGTLAAPAGLTGRQLSGRCGAGLDPCAALQTTVVLEPNAESEIAFFLGASRSEGEIRDLVTGLRKPGAIANSLRQTKDYWDRLLGVIAVETPNEATNLLLNRWLLYQTLSGRIWARSGFYQSGGAYGFRDQLQDVLALLYAKPEIAREHILRSAARQFVQGDVQHWWHPETGAGVRTRISDDLLWLPYAVSRYVRVTGDSAILEETVPFIETRLLDKGEHDAYLVPTVSDESATLWEHCRRALERSAGTGPHGLPLIGGGDWNDGLNLVGVGGRGESVWLGWFLIEVLRDFASVTQDPDAAQQFRTRAAELAAVIEAQAWDGGWYRRGYFDDGTPLGSKASPEARIDSLPQSWAAIAGGDQARTERAMQAVSDQLVKSESGLVLLFTPPFDSSPLQPGYIKGYPPGVRENGGQYTHGSLWAAMAFARLGNGDEAVRLLDMMNPVTRATDRYLVEPYVVAADVYALQGREGMGGWTWYTGSAAWMYRIWLEDILGIRIDRDRLTVTPVIPASWSGFSLSYTRGTSGYRVTTKRSAKAAGHTESVDFDNGVSKDLALTLPLLPEARQS